MADHLYMSWNGDWLLDDNMDDYTINWIATTGADVVQGPGYVQINHSAEVDQIRTPASEKSLPYTFDMEVVSRGTKNTIRVGDGTNHLYVHFPDTNSAKKHYRLIVRAFDTLPGSISFYENGKLIKSKADTVEAGTLQSVYYYVLSTAASGDYIQIHHHKHQFGADFGKPNSDQLRETIYLDGRNGYELLYHRVGSGMPKRRFIEDEIPFEAGSIHRATIIEPRDISLGVKIEGSTSSDLNEKIRALRRAMRRRGQLYAKMSDGHRYLNCSYSHGLEGTEQPDVTGQKWQKEVVSFRAFDPYWYGTQSFLTTFTFPSSLLKVTLSGDEETWPEFFVTGPGNQPFVKNNTTGKSFSININLATSSDFIYIRTKPGERTIQDQSGAVIWDKLATGFNEFWPLILGENSITITFTGGGTDSTTRAQMVHYERYLGV